MLVATLKPTNDPQWQSVGPQTASCGNVDKTWKRVPGSEKIGL